MNPSKTKKPIKGQNQKPMIEFKFQEIMGEYLITCTEWIENLNIQKAVAMNDEVYLRKILENEY